MNKFMTGALVALFSFVQLSAAYDFAKPSVSLKLYPDGQEADRGIVEDGMQITLGPLESNGMKPDGVSVRDDGFIYNICEPVIDIYLPENCNGQMIVICPGGGYSGCSALNEGQYAADWCVKRGIAACVVLYRMPARHHQIPLHDVQNAFRYCRAHAAEWGVKQIGVMGFSAGGHLAASASTLFVDGITRPDFSVLIYPVITLDPVKTHTGTQINLIGRDGSPELFERYSLEKQVSAATPPAILMLSSDDTTVPPVNSLKYYEAMQNFKIPGELHVFSTGGHGWGFSEVGTTGRDALRDGQRADFNSILSRWLEKQRNQ